MWITHFLSFHSGVVPPKVDIFVFFRFWCILKGVISLFGGDDYFLSNAMRRVLFVSGVSAV